MDRRTDDSGRNLAMMDRNQNTALAGLDKLIGEPEGERLEFKEARGGFHFEKLAKYCTALSNEGGGSIVLGVTDRRPRRVVGTHAFEEPGRDRRRAVRQIANQDRLDGSATLRTAGF